MEVYEGLLNGNVKDAAGLMARVLKEESESDVVAHANQSYHVVRSQNKGACCKFKASLVYMVDSRKI